jgi:hypothetical protein
VDSTSRSKRASNPCDGMATTIATGRDPARALPSGLGTRRQ